LQADRRLSGVAAIIGAAALSPSGKLSGSSCTAARASFPEGWQRLSASG
jgi:hypothetical protein